MGMCRVAENEMFFLSESWEGKDQDHNRRKTSLRRARKSARGDSGRLSFFAVEIVLREKEIQERKIDPLINDRRK